MISLSLFLFLFLFMIIFILIFISSFFFYWQHDLSITNANLQKIIVEETKEKTVKQIKTF